MAKINLLQSLEQATKKTVGALGWFVTGRDYARYQRQRMVRTPEGEQFYADYEKSFVGRLRRKIYNWTKSK